jgi:hypothetical protein
MTTIDDCLEASRLLAVAKAKDSIREKQKEARYFELLAKASELRAQAYEAEAAALGTMPNYARATTNGKDASQYRGMAVSARENAQAYAKLGATARVELRCLRRTGYPW